MASLIFWITYKSFHRSSYANVELLWGTLFCCLNNGGPKGHNWCFERKLCSAIIFTATSFLGGSFQDPPFPKKNEQTKHTSLSLKGKTSTFAIQQKLSLKNFSQPGHLCWLSGRRGDFWVWEFLPEQWSVHPGLVELGDIFLPRYIGIISYNPHWPTSLEFLNDS